MKFLVTELIWPEGLEELEASGEVDYDPDLWQKPEEVCEVTKVLRGQPSLCVLG